MERSSVEFNKDLHDDLVLMGGCDQRLRKKRDLTDEDIKEIEEVDDINIETLKKIINQYGWPGISLVGEDGARVAWLIAQHADKEVEFQRSCLEELKKAVERGEAKKEFVAFLTDRVLVNSGLKQIFGTQFHKDETGEYVPRPIEDMEGLEARRSEYGLDSFKEYSEGFSKFMKK